MEAQEILSIVSRWIHIISAAAAVGGMIFLRVVLMPAAAESLSTESHDKLRGAVMARWRRIVMAAIGLLLVTGVYNFYVAVMQAPPDHKPPPAYHSIFGVKLLMALAIFFIASALVGRSSTFARLRARAPTWLLVSLALSLLVILLGATLREIRS